jgi:hypothetical protein
MQQDGISGADSFKNTIFVPNEKNMRQKTSWQSWFRKI